jgi:putative oxidoreductase
MSSSISKPSLLNRIARVLLCLVFINAVIGKLVGFTDTAAAIAAKGLPFATALVVLSMLLMAAGSALVISGWRSRLGAVLLLIFLIPTTLLFHSNAGDAAERIQLLKNLAIIAGLLVVIDQENV